MIWVLSLAMEHIPCGEFLLQWVFNCDDDPALAALQGTAIGKIFTWSVLLCGNERSRYTLGDFLQQRKRVHLGFTAPLWYNTSLQKAFKFWRLVHARCLPWSKLLLEIMSGISRKARCLLSKAGVCAAGVESHACHTFVVAAPLWEQLCGWQHIL